MFVSQKYFLFHKNISRLISNITRLFPQVRAAAGAGGSGAGQHPHEQRHVQHQLQGRHGVLAAAGACSRSCIPYLLL